MTTEEVAEAFKKSTATELSRRFENKKVALTGPSSGFGKDGLGGYASFLGGKVRCMFNQEPYELARGKLEAAAAESEPVTVRGIVVGIHANKLIIRDCSLGEGKPAAP